MKAAITFSALAFSIAFFSCSSDDNGNNPQEENQLNNPIIIGYTGSRMTVPDDENAPTYFHAYTGTLSDNKFLKVTDEFFINGEPKNTSLRNEYIYSGGLLQSYTGEHTLIDKKDLFYDDQENLIALNWQINDIVRYYRFQHINDAQVYFEEISLPYNDPQAQIIKRNIILFDENYNIIKAGKDFDQNGQMDYENSFKYDGKNNLVEIHLYTGESKNIAYSTIINTENYLDDNAFHKKNRRIITSEIYALNSLNVFLDLEHSYNVSLQQSEDNMYEVLPNNFYYKKIEQNKIDDSTITTTDEYTFQ